MCHLWIDIKSAEVCGLWGCRCSEPSSKPSKTPKQAHKGEGLPSTYPTGPARLVVRTAGGGRHLLTHQNTWEKYVFAAYGPIWVNKWRQSEPKMTPKWLKVTLMCQKWYHNDFKVTPKWFQNDPKVTQSCIKPKLRCFLRSWCSFFWQHYFFVKNSQIYTFSWFLCWYIRVCIYLGIYARLFIDAGIYL